MNDITALAQRMKAAAEKATPGRIGDRIDGSGSIKYECRGYDDSLVLRTDHKNMEYGFVGDNGTADEEFFLACVPDNVLALVEALEKAQQDSDGVAGMAEHYETTISMLRGRIAEMESRTVTVKPAVYGYLRENDGQIQISIGPDRPSDRAGGYATPWFAIYTAAGIQVIEGEQKNG